MSQAEIAEFNVRCLTENKQYTAVASEEPRQCKNGRDHSIEVSKVRVLGAFVLPHPAYKS